MFLPWLFGRGFCPLLGVTAHKGLTLFSFLSWCLCIVMGLACVVDGSIPSRGAGGIGGVPPVLRAGVGLWPFSWARFVAGWCCELVTPPRLLSTLRGIAMDEELKQLPLSEAVYYWKKTLEKANYKQPGRNFVLASIGGVLVYRSDKLDGLATPMFAPAGVRLSDEEARALMAVLSLPRLM